MENNSARKIRFNYALPFLLVLITLFICFKNYTPNTFLTGWDTLHPEFNFSLYWKRILGGAWQEHQGLGTVASQAHAAEIPRVLILQLLDIFLAVSQIRYAYAFIALISGTLGMYFFLRELFVRKTSVSAISAFLGALFYLLNLGTLQNFYVPLEMFLTHFATLGWLFLFILKYLNGNRSALYWFGAIAFVSAPQAHTSTLFVAFLFVFTVFLSVFSLHGVRAELKLRLRKSILLFLVLMFTNAFWFGPNLYFVSTRSQEVSQSKIHRLFSEEAFLQNQEFGSFDNVSVLRGFLFNWGEHVGGGQFGDLLNEWKVYQAKPYISLLGYVFFGISMLGIFAVFFEREDYASPLLGIFLVAIFFIINANPPTGALFTFLQERMPLFKEAFRFPFTKFSTLLAFSYATFFGYALYWVFSKTAGWSLGRIIIPVAGVLMILSLILYMFPVFTGNLISPSMRISIPERYFKLFDYFDSQEEWGRVANLPIHSFWGWSYYNWEPITKRGYQGAGFLWFGIKQPLLDREFDRWGSVNEQYFREMSYAVYSQDAKLLSNVFAKHQIKWILLDKSIFQPGVNDKVLFYDEIERLLGDIPAITLEKDFGDGLVVYKVDADYESQFVLSEVPVLGPSFSGESYDPIYMQMGDYISSSVSDYPFVGIVRPDESLNDFIVSSDEDFVYFETDISDTLTDSLLFDLIAVRTGGSVSFNLVGVSTGEVIASQSRELPESFMLSIDEGLSLVWLEEEGREYIISQSVAVPGEFLDVKIYGAGNTTSVSTASFSVLESCSSVGAQTAYTLETNESGFNLSARNVKACVTTPLEKILERPSTAEFILRIDASVVEDGARGEICVLNNQTGSCGGTSSIVGGRMFSFVSLSADDFPHYYLRFFANSRGGGDSTVSYKDLQLSFLEERDLISFNIPDAVGSNLNIEQDLKFKKLVSLNAEELGFASSPYECGSGSRELDLATVDFSKESIKYTVGKDFVCDSFKLHSISSQKGTLLEVRSRNLEGLPMRLCLTNEFSSRCDVYVSLPKSEKFTTTYYLVPPMGEGDHTVSLTNLSFGKREVSINELSYLGVAPVPYKFLMSLHEVAGERASPLVFSEAFDSGWLALCGFKKCDADHVLVNNWANGWVFRDGKVPGDVRIVFWPQFLQPAGYFLLAGVFVFFAVDRKKWKNVN